MRLKIVDGKAVFGDWSLEKINDPFEEVDINIFTNRQKREFFHFVGHALHAVQQGVCVLRYKDFEVSASDIKDTSGKPIGGGTGLTIKQVDSGSTTENVHWAVLKYL
jgi:hypothetical protein